MNQIGLLGGTFDPVHNGHLQLAQIVLDSVGLDQVLFIPAAHPPHKNESIVSSSTHRLAMLRLALMGKTGMEISDIEMGRRGMSYTFDTLEELKQAARKRTQYHFIIGSDAIADIATWHRWQELLVSINFVVAVRPGFSLKEIEVLLGRNGFRPEKDSRKRWIHKQWGNEMFFLADETVDISSTDIRSRICSGRDWKHLVPEKVAGYIHDNHLYETMS